MAMDERRRAVIGTSVVFGLAALVGCSSAMSGAGSGSGSGAAGAAAAPVIATTTTMVAPTTEATTTTTVAPTTTAAPATTAAPTTTAAPATTEPKPVPTVAAASEPLQAVGSNAGEQTARVQARLLELGFWLNEDDGEYGLTTSQAVMAFQKYMGFSDPSGSVDAQTAQSLTVETVRPQSRANSGTLVEIDKAKQLLFFVVDGSVEWILNASTGNGKAYTEEDKNTPGEVIDGVSLTPSGLHEVDREREDGWWEGDLGRIYRPKYFVGGVAVHGSSSIPNYPASHGCVRVSVPAMDWIWESGIMPMDTSVWVHDGA